MKCFEDSFKSKRKEGSPNRITSVNALLIETLHNGWQYNYRHHIFHKTRRLGLLTPGEPVNVASIQRIIILIIDRFNYILNIIMMMIFA